MAQYFDVHPDNPQPRLFEQAVALLEQGGVVAVPTDSSYALACHLDDKAAADRLRQIRGVDEKHLLTLLCRDLSELATYARVDNRQYRLLKCGDARALTPSSSKPPAKCRAASAIRSARPSACGCRTTGCCRQLLALHGAPLLATTLIPPHETEPLNDAQEIRERFERPARRRDRRRRLPVAAHHGDRPDPDGHRRRGRGDPRRAAASWRRWGCSDCGHCAGPGREPVRV